MANTDQNAQNGLQGSSYVYRLGTSPNTRAVVSQKVRILAPSYGSNDALYQIGVIATFNPTESRTIDPIRGIGFGDIIAELVPSNTEPMTASVERTLLYLSNIWQATGYASGVSGPVRSLRHHRWPFDVEQQIVFSRIADADLAGGFDGPMGATPWQRVYERCRFGHLPRLAVGWWLRWARGAHGPHHHVRDVLVERLERFVHP